MVVEAAAAVQLRSDAADTRTDSAARARVCVVVIIIVFVVVPPPPSVS